MYINEFLRYEEQYQYLENLRRSGVTNMFGATRYLLEEFPYLTQLEARKILASWMDNYTELKQQFGW